MESWEPSAVIGESGNGGSSAALSLIILVDQLVTNFSPGSSEGFPFRIQSACGHRNCGNPGGGKIVFSDVSGGVVSLSSASVTVTQQSAVGQSVSVNWSSVSSIGVGITGAKVTRRGAIVTAKVSVFWKTVNRYFPRGST